MAIVTRGNLKTRILRKANTSGYVDNSAGGELEDLINTSLGKIHNLLVELYEDFFISRSNFALVANQAVYPLPADCMKPRAVWFLTPSLSTPADLTQATGVLLSRMDISQALQAWSVTSTSAPYGYALESTTLTIVPAPSSTANYIGLKYIPQYTPALNDATPIEFAIAYGWDEWVVNDVVLQIRIKAMMPTADVKAERDSFEQAIRRQAKNRDALNPPKVRDTGWKYGNNGVPWGNFAFRS